jgi:hypothetical protein
MAAKEAAAEDHELSNLSKDGRKQDDEELDFEDMEKLDEVTTPGGFSQEEETAVLKKLDRRVVGLISLLYLLSFLDRSSRTPQPRICAG